MFQKLYLLSILLLMNENVDATDCRNCYNINQGSCFDTTPGLNRTNEFPTCSVHSKNLEMEMKRIYGANFEHKTRSVYDIRCVHFEKYYKLTKQVEVFRGCLQKKYAKEFCDKQRNNQDYYFYNLTKCNVCSSDLCNSTLKINFNQNLALILILFTIFYK